MRPTQNPEPHPEQRSRLSVGLISAAGVIAATGWLASSSPVVGPVSTGISATQGGLVQAVGSDSASDQQEFGPAHHPKPALPRPPLLDSLASVSIQLKWDPDHTRGLLDAPKQGPPARR